MKLKLKCCFKSWFAVGVYLVVGSALPVAVTAQEPDSAVRIALTPAYPNLAVQKPLFIVVPPDATERKFLVQQWGQILILPEDENGEAATLFLDVSGRDLFENDFEEGLLGLAFHPDFKSNQAFYIYYSQQNPKRSVVSEWKVSSDDPNRADPASERIVMEVPQVFWNHNSGQLLFGKDGMLYISLGDGGSANDPFNNAQNLQTLLGSILRIDVDSRTGSLPYGIPEDNPFVHLGERARPEIYAYGLRNPWGMYMDEETGLFWCADVGQNKYEEVDLIVPGGNYGWNYREGAHPFDLNKTTPPASFQPIEPVVEYDHREGISITGGVVYRGERIPDLKGCYIYGDWFSGKIWALELDENQKIKRHHLIFTKEITSPVKIGAFSILPNGELIISSLDHTLWHVVPSGI